MSGEPEIDRLKWEIRTKPEFSVAFRVNKLTPSHVWVDLFSGRTKETRGWSGELCFRKEDWPAMTELLDGIGERVPWS